LCEVASDVDPWNAARGGIGKAWEEVKKRVQSRGVCTERGVDWIKRRVTELIEFKESPNWSALQHQGEGESATVLGDNKYGITAQSIISLAAPLEKCAHLKELASERRDGQVRTRGYFECRKARVLTNGGRARLVEDSI
jgi:hypothetical protein